MSRVISRGKAKLLHRKGPNEAEIPPALTDEEASLSWGMQVQGIFKKAGMDKYLEETLVQGGTIRLAVPDDGGLCDHPDCPKEYEYALKLDSFRTTATEGYSNGNLVREGFDSSIRRQVVSFSPGQLKGPATIMVCADHRDWRPVELPQSHRYAEDYAPKGRDFRGPHSSRIPNITRENRAS